MFMAQERCCIPFDGGQGTAQFMAHSCKQFCLEQFHIMERIAVSDNPKFSPIYLPVLFFSLFPDHTLVPSLLCFFENRSALRRALPVILLHTEIACCNAVP